MLTKQSDRVNELDVARSPELSASGAIELMSNIEYQYAATLSTGGASSRALQLQQNNLIQQARRDSSEQRTQHDVLAFQMQNDRVLSSEAAAEGHRAPQSLQLEQLQMQSYLTLLARNQQDHEHQLSRLQHAFALQDFKKQRTLRGQHGGVSQLSSVAGFTRSAWPDLTGNHLAQLMANHGLASTQPIPRQGGGASNRLQELLVLVHVQTERNHPAASNVAPSPELSLLQNRLYNPNWPQSAAVLQRFDAQTTYNGRLSQFRGQAEVLSSGARQILQGPMPTHAFLGSLPTDSFVRESWQQGSSQIPLQIDPMSADNALLIQILKNKAARTQDAAEYLAALQLLQHSQALPPATHATEGNNSLVRHFDQEQRKMDQLRGYPGPVDNAAKTKEIITSFPMETPSDVDELSSYQVLIRLQLVYFISQKDDADFSVQGRKRQARLGQVGIRCKHCSHLPHRLRGRGAGYYPAKLSGVYQAAQNMATHHLSQFCNSIPLETREKLRTLRGGRHDSASGGGKLYWADSCREIGLVEVDDGLRFRSSNGPR